MDELGLAKTVYEWFRGRKMEKAVNEETSASQCVACSSQSVSTIAERAYRCDDCGYEGGPGWAGLAQQRKAERIAAMSPGARRQRARECLLEAAQLLEVGMADLEQASRESVYDIVGLNVGEGFGEGEGAAKLTRLTAGIGRMLEARTAAIEAELCLQIRLELGPVDPRSGTARIHVLTEADLWFDNLVVDAMTRARVRDTIAQAQALRGVVADALARHFPEERS